MNERGASSPNEMPAETRLDDGVARMREIDQHVHELRQERARIAEEVHKLRDVLSRKVDDAGQVAEGMQPAALTGLPSSHR